MGPLGGNAVTRGEPSRMRLGPCKRGPTELAQAAHNAGHGRLQRRRGPHLSMLAPSSWTSSFQTVRITFLLFVSYPVSCILLEQPERTKTSEQDGVSALKALIVQERSIRQGATWCCGYGHTLWSQPGWVRVLHLPLTGCMTLGQVLYLYGH